MHRTAWLGDGQSSLPLKETTLVPTPMQRMKCESHCVLAGNQSDILLPLRLCVLLPRTAYRILSQTCRLTRLTKCPAGLKTFAYAEHTSLPNKVYVYAEYIILPKKVQVPIDFGTLMTRIFSQP